MGYASRRNPVSELALVLPLELGARIPPGRLFSFKLKKLAVGQTPGLGLWKRGVEFLGPQLKAQALFEASNAQFSKKAEQGNMGQTGGKRRVKIGASMGRYLCTGSGLGTETARRTSPGFRGLLRSV